jgi:hypothetical protein
MPRKRHAPGTLPYTLDQHMNAHEMRVVIAFPFVVRRIKPQRERAARVVHPTADSLVRAKVNEARWSDAGMNSIENSKYLRNICIFRTREKSFRVKYRRYLFLVSRNLLIFFVSRPIFSCLLLTHLTSGPSVCAQSPPGRVRRPQPGGH